MDFLALLTASLFFTLAAVALPCALLSDSEREKPPSWMIASLATALVATTFVVAQSPFIIVADCIIWGLVAIFAWAYAINPEMFERDQKLKSVTVGVVRSYGWISVMAFILAVRFFALSI